VLRVHVRQPAGRGRRCPVELDPRLRGEGRCCPADWRGTRSRRRRPSTLGSREGRSGNLVQARGALTAAVFSISSAAAAIGQANADLAAAESRKSLAELNLKRARALVEANVCRRQI